MFLQIHFVILVSRQGKVRLTKWFSTYSQKERSKVPSVTLFDDLWLYYFVYYIDVQILVVLHTLGFCNGRSINSSQGRDDDCWSPLLLQICNVTFAFRQFSLSMRYISSDMYIVIITTKQLFQKKKNQLSNYFKKKIN